MDVLSGIPRVDPAVSSRIRGWVIDAWPAPAPQLVTVSQLRCKKAECPTLETVVVVAPQPGTSHNLRFHLPAGDVTERHLRDAIDTLHKDTP